MVVDDNDVNRQLARVMLEQAGCHVVTAADGDEGLLTARASAPDLIFLDLAMPKMDGYAVARALKGDPATAEIPIVALTAMAMPGDEDKAYAAGIDGYLTKPIESHQLEATLREYLGIGQERKP